MSAATRTLALFAVLLPFVGSAVPPAAGQVGPSAHVTGFDAFPWGTPQDELTARLGDPVRADTLAGGAVVVLVYPGTFADTATAAFYALFPDRGLVKGQHSIPFGSDDDCVALFLRFRQTVNLRYPLLLPDDRTRNDSTDEFCSSVETGTAAWITRWDDEDTGARASITVEAGQTRVNAVFESAAFLEWLERRTAEAESEADMGAGPAEESAPDEDPPPG